jgi:hypothetical protein
VVLIGGRVHDRPEILRRAPLAVHEVADVQITEAEAARSQRREHERPAVHRDLRIELPCCLQVWIARRGHRVDASAEGLARCEAVTAALRSVDVPMPTRLREERTAGEIQRSVCRHRRIELVGRRTVDLGTEVDRLAPAVRRALDHPEVDVIPHHTVHRADRREVETLTVRREKGVDVAVDSGE